MPRSRSTNSTSRLDRVLPLRELGLVSWIITFEENKCFYIKSVLKTKKSKLFP
jgi:hypothetical protein